MEMPNLLSFFLPDRFSYNFSGAITRSREMLFLTRDKQDTADLILQAASCDSNFFSLHNPFI